MIYRPESGCGCKHVCRPGCCPPCRPPFPPIPPVPPVPPVTTTPSVLTAANTTTQTVAAAGALPFTLNPVSYGTAILHTPGSSVVTITEPGIYRADYNGITAPAAGGTTARTELQLNGVVLPGAAADSTYAAATDTESQSINTAFAVTTAPATLSVVLPDGGVVTDSALTVQRLGALPAAVPATAASAATAVTYPAYPNYPNYPSYPTYPAYTNYPYYGF